MQQRFIMFRLKYGIMKLAAVILIVLLIGCGERAGHEETLQPPVQNESMPAPPEEPEQPPEIPPEPEFVQVGMCNGTRFGMPFRFYILGSSKMRVEVKDGENTYVSLAHGDEFYHWDDQSKVGIHLVLEELRGDPSLKNEWPHLVYPREIQETAENVSCSRPEAMPESLFELPPEVQFTFLNNVTQE
jgi:hypothetical protein